MGPLTIIYLLHNFLNSNSWIIQFFCGPFSFELDRFDCVTGPFQPVELFKLCPYHNQYLLVPSVCGFLFNSAVRNSGSRAVASKDKTIN
jgi:hypothetical protein